MVIFNNKIIKNFSVLTGTNLVIQILSILSSIRLARQLHPIGYGVFNLVLLQSSIFAIVSMYGLRFVMIRQIARNNHDATKIFKLSNQIRFFTTLVAFSLAIGYNQIQTSQSISTDITYIILVLIVCQSFWDSIESVAFGLEKMWASGFINLFFTVVWIIEIYAIPNHLFTISSILFAYAFNQITKSFIYYIWLRKKVLILNDAYTIHNFEDHQVLLRQSNYYFMLAVLALLINQIPILLLQFNSTVDQIGLFNLGNRILSPLQMMLNMLLTALFPMLARLATENSLLFAKRIKSLLNIIVLVGIWGCICLSLLINDVVNFLYGIAYATSANIILVQCWFTVMFAISCTIGTVLNSYDQQKRLTQISFLYAIIAAPIFYFGSKHGAIGLAWAFVIAAFVNMTYQWVIFKKLLQNQISYQYAFVVFGSIGLLALGTNIYKFEWALPLRIVVVIILTLIVFYYLFKIEYKKIKIL